MKLQDYSAPLQFFAFRDTAPQTRNLAKGPALPLGLAGKESGMNIVSACCSKGKKVAGQARFFIKIEVYASRHMHGSPVKLQGSLMRRRPVKFILSCSYASHQERPSIRLAVSGPLGFSTGRFQKEADIVKGSPSDDRYQAMFTNRCSTSFSSLPMHEPSKSH